MPRSSLVASLGRVFVSRSAADLPRLAGRLVFGAFVALVVLAPLPLGCYRPIPWNLLAVLTALLLAAHALIEATGRPARPLAIRPLVPAMVAFALVVGLVLLQVAPIVPSAWHHPLWLEAALVLGPERGGTISVDPYATLTGLMRLLTYAGVFWLAVRFGRSPGHAHHLLVALVLAGTAYAAYGLVLGFLGSDMLLWWERWYAMSGITSTFTNRNHYATYAGLGLVVATALLIRALARTRARPEEQQARGLPGSLLRAGWLLPAFLTIATALVMTQSRAGTAAAALGLATLCVCFGTTRLLPRSTVAASAGLLLVISLAILALAGDDLAQRLEKTDLEAENRFTVFARVASAIGDAPLLGTGLGTFADVFRIYQGTVTNFFFDHAHNTYLENALELGVGGAALLVFATAWIVGWMARRLPTRRGGAVHAAIALAASVVVGAHALLDFSLEIPAIAYTYYALLGITYGRLARPRATHPPVQLRGSQGRVRVVRRGRRFRPWMGSLAVAGALLLLGVPRLAAHLHALPADLVDARLDTGVVPGPGATDRAIAGGNAASAWIEIPRILQRAAMAEFAHTRLPAMSANAQRARLLRARDGFRRSLGLAPANAIGWARLAETELSLGRDRAAVSDALALSVKTAPNHRALLLHRSRLAAVAWPILGATTKGLFRAQFANVLRTQGARTFVDTVMRYERARAVRITLRHDRDATRTFDHLVARWRDLG